MTKVISKLYPTYERAQAAVRDLEAAGVASGDISIVSNNSDNWFSSNGTPKRVDRDGDGVDDRAEGAGKGAGVGAAVGGAAGLLAGLGLLAIPGVGPVVAAGWLVATAAGAAAGGLTGGIIGALTQAGVSEEDAHVYAEGVRRGGTLVTARVDDRAPRSSKRRSNARPCAPTTCARPTASRAGRRSTPAPSRTPRMKCAANARSISKRFA